MIYQTVNADDFVQAFDLMDRGNQFSRLARYELFTHLNELSDDIDQPLELDVIALCVEWAEFTPDEIVREYDWLSDGLTTFDALLDVLRDNTQVIEVDNGASYLIQEF